MTRVGTSRWSVDVLPGWAARHDPECLSIERSDGVGSLQISGAVKEAGLVTDADLLGMIDEADAAASRHACSVGEFSGLSWSYQEDDTYWRRWLLRKDSLVLFVTYNCASRERTIEDADIDHMLGTLRKE
jgi:hypothetical protein